MGFVQRFQMMTTIRTFYLNHETIRSKELMSMLSVFAHHLGGSFLIGGSVGFGQAEQESDLDIAYIGPDLPRFRREIQIFEISRSIDINSVEIDIDLVESAVECRGLPYDYEELLRFMGFAWTCRHLDTSLFPLFNCSIRCFGEHWDHLTLNTSIPGCRSRDFAISWEKYELRLQARGIRIPHHVTMLQNYLITS